MKIGDLVAYAWNAKERPEEVELAIVVDPHPAIAASFAEEYIQIYLLSASGPPLKVPSLKLDVLSESR